MQGQKLGGRYRIVKEIGKGGFGVTFVAEDTQRPGNPKCVVKQFKPIVTNPDALQVAERLFNDEAETLEKLGKHDQIPQLLAHFEEHQEFYLVQEFIEGHDLSEEMPLGKQLSEAEVIKLLQEILFVLTFVHQHGVIHRDIKPSNIRRRQSDGKVVLIDFGAVKQISTQVVNSQGQPALTIAIGTAGYMPSEQSNGHPKFSSDLYAVGIVGIQALTGILPTELPKDVNTHEIIWRDQAQVSQQLADILDKMVRYDFRQRYQSAESALQALQQLSPSDVQGGQNSQVSPPASSGNLTRLQRQTFVITIGRFVSSTRPRKLLIGVGIVAAVATVIVLLSQFKTPTPKFLTYENPSYGIKIKYPEGWERQDIDNNVAGANEVVRFLSPKQSDADKFQESVSISVENFSSTLEASRDSFINEIKNTLPEAKIINTSSTTLANKPANKLVYTGKGRANSLKNLQVWTLKGDKAYVITYTAKIDDYDAFFQTAEQMIQSLEIK